MSTLSSGQILAGVAVVAVLAGGVILANGGLGGGSDGGIDVSKTACEDIASARIAVNNEFEERKAQAGEARDSATETAVDAYVEQHHKLETAYYECTTKALTSDPCKEPFEEIGRLYNEIMADFDAGKGFNEAKFNEREAAKKEYYDCVEQTHKPEFYKEKADKCEAEFKAGQEANLQVRQKADVDIKSAYDKAVADATEARAKKDKILDAIEKKCNEPGGKTAVSVGGLTTEGTGTAIQSGSSACTGMFAGNDPDLMKRIRNLENQLNKAKAAGLTDGVFGTAHLQTALSDLRTELANSQRKCTKDTDCGDAVPVCCSGTEVGQAVCASGVCTAKKTLCVDPEVCAGKPAMCVAPSTGATSKAIEISRTIPQVGTCSQNLQTLDLQQASGDSDRYEITGNIPSWLKFDKVSGKLPAKVNVSYSCGTVQGFGPGTYTASGIITIYNTANELINTIPLNITITVTPVTTTGGGTTGVVGTPPTTTGTAPTPTPTETAATPVSATPSELSFTYDHQEPVCPLRAGTISINGPAGSTWQLTSDLPVWLVPKSRDYGNVPDSLVLNFPCQLDSYQNQTQSVKLDIEVTAPDGKKTKQTVKVTGHFEGFAEY